MYSLSILSIVLAAQPLAQVAPAEPTPVGWGATGEALLRHAENKPDIFFPILCVALAVGIPLLFCIAVLRYWLPRWEAQAILDRASRENQATLTREHSEKLLNARGVEAASDAAQQREYHRVQNDSIIQRVEGNLARVTGEITKIGDRLERHGDQLRSIASKMGVGVLAVLLAMGLGYIVQRQYYAIAAPNCKCDPPCNAGMHCTCTGCKENTSSPADKPKTETKSATQQADLVPHSAIQVSRLATAERAYVIDACNRTSEACL